MKLTKIPINKLEEMTYTDLDSKRALIERILAERINELIDKVDELILKEKLSS